MSLESPGSAIAKPFDTDLCLGHPSVLIHAGESSPQKRKLQIARGIRCNAIYAP